MLLVLLEIDLSLYIQIRCWYISSEFPYFRNMQIELMPNLFFCLSLPFMNVVVKDIARLVNVYHPSLWGNRSYPCCGSSQRSTSKATNGCRSVTWTSDALLTCVPISSSAPKPIVPHMGINFSQILHSSSSGSTPGVGGGHSVPSPSPVAGTSAVHKLSVNNGSGGAPELDIPGVKSQSSAGGIVDVQSGTAAGDIPVGSLISTVLVAVAGNFRSINVFTYAFPSIIP